MVGAAVARVDQPARDAPEPLSLRADSRWQSTVFFTPFNDAVQRQSAYGLLDLSAELGPRRWTVGVYART